MPRAPLVSKALAIAAAVAFTPIAACAGAPRSPDDAKIVVVSLQKIDCVDCGREISDELRQDPGVYDVILDARRGEIRVSASPTFDVLTHVRKLAALKGFETALSSGQDRIVELGAFPSGSDVRIVARDGADVPDLATTLARGKVTIVEFTAGWCGPCRELDRHVAVLLRTEGRLAYRRLDIGDWDSPLARRYLGDVPKLPFILVFDPKGAKVQTIAGLDFPALDAAVKEGLAQRAP